MKTIIIAFFSGFGIYDDIILSLFIEICTCLNQIHKVPIPYNYCINGKHIDTLPISVVVHVTWCLLFWVIFPSIYLFLSVFPFYTFISVLLFCCFFICDVFVFFFPFFSFFFLFFWGGLFWFFFCFLFFFFFLLFLLFFCLYSNCFFTL